MKHDLTSLPQHDATELFEYRNGAYAAQLLSVTESISKVPGLLLPIKRGVVKGRKGADYCDPEGLLPIDQIFR